MATIGRCENDVISDDNGGHGITDCLDDTGTLVAEDRGVRGRVNAIADERVGVADPCCDQSHPYLVVAQLIELELFDAELFPDATGYCCCDLHLCLLVLAAPVDARVGK
jgi:hypothetical protein